MVDLRHRHRTRLATSVVVREAVTRRIFLLVAPIVIAAIGALWMLVALRHFERSTGHGLQGLIGYHYSMPEWGFKYAPGGADIERWSFHVPTGVTFGLLLISAVIGTVKRWRDIGVWRTVGLWLYHFVWAIVFFIIYAALWMHAASVFI